MPYGVLTMQEGGFLRKKLTYRHVLGHQLMSEVWTNKDQCLMSLQNAVNIAGAGLAKGWGEYYEHAVADGPQQYNITHRHFQAAYYDEPARLGETVVRAIIAPFDEIPFLPVAVMIYGYMQGNQPMWDLCIPGWLDTFAVLSDQRKAEEAADGVVFHIGNAVLAAVLARLVPNHPMAAMTA